MECRLCFSSEEDSINNPFTAPCNCNGSIKWIHQECHNLQRTYERKVGIFRCPTCGYYWNSYDKFIDQSVRPIFNAGVQIGSLLSLMMIIYVLIFPQEPVYTPLPLNRSSVKNPQIEEFFSLIAEHNRMVHDSAIFIIECFQYILWMGDQIRSIVSGFS